MINTTNTPETNYVAYIRVSTQRQGESGLGLEAQLSAIDNHIRTHGGVVVQTYREVESGRKANRPELAKAIVHAKRIRGRLLIAKLDRLARNVHFVTSVMQSGVDFVAVDNPYATKLTIHILAAVAENEAEMISLRTKAALAIAKSRGLLLGSARPGHWAGREHLWKAAQQKATIAARAKHQASAEPIYGQVVPRIRQLRAEGRSFQGIADNLNADGLSTLQGAQWNKVQVRRLFLTPA